MTDVFKVLERAKAMGVSAELYSIRRREGGVRRENQYYARSLQEEGYGLRVFKDGKVGSAFSTILTDDLLEKAMSSIRASEEDVDNVPPPPSRPRHLNLRDELDLQELPKELMRTLEDLREKVNLVSIDVDVEESTIKIVSTEGVDAEETRTGIYVSVMANYKESGTVSPEVWESASSRFRRGIDVDLIKREVIEKVKISAKREKLGRKPKVIAFTPKAAAELLGPIISSAINGENVFRGRSPLKLKEKYGSLTVVDNPEDEMSPYSRSFDGEGQQTSRKVVLEEGVFSRPLTNWYWSRKLKIENSCSAIRSFASTPSIGVSNLELEHPGRAEETPGTLVIDQVQGVHTSNWETGEFGVVAPVSWYVENNQIKGVREVVISGNLRSLLEGIVGTYGEKRRYMYLRAGHLVTEGLNVVY